MSLSLRPSGILRTAAVIGLIGVQTGCTSVLTTASLRELVWKPPEHAAAEDSAAAALADTTSGPEAEDAAAQSDAGRRTAAIEEAVARLARLGRLDAATEATLVETLQRTQPEDWPVVVEAFAAALPPPEPAQPQASAPQDAEPESAKAGSVPEAATSSSSNPTAPATPHAAARPMATGPTAVRTATPATPDAAEASASVPPTPPSAPEPLDESTASSGPTSFPAGPRAADSVAVESRPSLRLQNACFASRVRGWGDVERFAGQRFEAGQEVIVYFELDGLAATDTAAGCTTRIDTALALNGPDGERIHTWRFDPLEETCQQRRRDYFARYLVVLPANASGRCRLEVSVSDAVAAQSAGATLPLDIIPATHAR